MHFSLPLLLGAATSLLPSALGADADAWSQRSIYQLITDRFAPPSTDAPALTAGAGDCAVGSSSWCGGTWRSVMDKLDYLQGLGVDAVWISPTGSNIDVATPYGFAYHGYWINDPTKLNPRFGSSDDLKALSSALHARGMYLMVDVAINSVISSQELAQTPTQQSLAADPALLWQNPDNFHTYCPVDYSNATSATQCWLGDTKVPLMDVNTENAQVISTLQGWITSFVQEYGVDGLRIDAAKHVAAPFWPGFCKAAGVFCIGEVYNSDLPSTEIYQTQGIMDSILNYPLYAGIQSALTLPGPQNMSALVESINGINKAFPHPEYLGNFLENHDLPRFRNATVDPQIAYNALVFQHLSDGIPIVYYGQEQDISFGAGDPYNRQALWADGNGGYSNSTTYQRIRRLNDIRHWLISNGTTFNGNQTFIGSRVETVTLTQNDFAYRKGPLLVALTNRGSPSVDATLGMMNVGWSGTVVE